MSAFARGAAKALFVAAAAGIVVGAVIGLVKSEGVLQWMAYGLDGAGAVLIGIGFLTGPEAPRKRYIRERVLKQPAPPRGESRLLTFAAAGIVLVAAGTLLEIML